MRTKYKIPDFKVTELIQAIYGVTINEAGGGYYCKCPVTEHKTPARLGNFRMYPDNGAYGTVVCACGVSGTIWTFLEEYHGLPGWGSPDFDETILWVCDRLGVEPVKAADVEMTIEDHIRAFYRDLIKSLDPIHFTQPNPHFTQDENGAFLYRGIDVWNWHSMGVGMLSEAAYRDLLRRHSTNVINQAGFGSWRRGREYPWLREGVIVPFRSEYGSVIGIGVRRYPEEFGGQEDPKYVKVSNHPLMRYGQFLFGEREVRRSNAPVLYIVEGEFDCMSLQMRGLEAVTCFGMGTPSKEQLDKILLMGKRPVMVCDNDENGAGFLNALRLANRAPDISFILLPGEEGKMDPDLFVTRYGLDALRELTTFTSLEIQMFAEVRSSQTGVWSSEVDGLVWKYMKHILDHPTINDEIHVERVAELSGRDVDYLKNWLIQNRNRATLEALLEYSNPIRLAV